MKRQLAGILLTCLATAAVGADLGEADQITFHKHKGKIYAAYLKELKTDPGLQGKVVLEIRIERDGHVSSCRVNVAPTPKLGDALCARIREIPFPPREAATTGTKRIDFFPAA